MATNADVPVGDTEMSECDGGEVVTMMDVLKEQQEFEDDANAVLGGSDDKECTYSQGYIKRQAIYACMTCCPESKEVPSKRAGFCLACSLTCHENHDLIELYTKRNFRCDCGNPKFKSSCQFTPTKPDLNDENIYNQNFVGLYCICSKPYGEQENALDDEMIQCVVCEDWWHAAHLEAIVPAHDQFSEMICKLCMAKNEFLHSYSDLTVNVESGDVDVVNTNGVDSIIPDEKLTNGSVADENLGNGFIADDKLVNGSLTDETMVDEKKNDGKQNNENQEKIASNEVEANTTEASVRNKDNEANSSEKESTVLSNAENDASESKNTEFKTDQEISSDMETSTTEAPYIGDEPVSTHDNEASSSEKESAVLNAENDASEFKNTIETDQEISSDMETSTTEAPFVGDEPISTHDNEASSSEKESIVSHNVNVDNNALEPKKAVETHQEISTTDAIMDTAKDKLEEKTSEDVNESPVDKTESSPTRDKLEEKNAIFTVDSTEKKEETNEITAEEVHEKPSTETQPYESKNNDSSEQAIAEAINTAEIEKSSNVESKEQQKEVIDDVDTTNSLIAEVEKSDDPHTANTESNEAAEGESSTAMQEETTSKVDEAVDSSKETECTNIENGKSVVLETITEKRKLFEDDAEDSPAKKPKIDGQQCVRPKGVKKVHKGATFWPSNFRQKLCTCNECISMYKDLSVLFLTDMEDTVTAYETLGKERTAGKPNQYEKGIEALCSLGRIQQIDALTEYNKMRDKLLTFLQSFKEKKEVVTEHDIKTFFAGMKPEKRNDGVYFCG